MTTANTPDSATGRATDRAADGATEGVAAGTPDGAHGGEPGPGHGRSIGPVGTAARVAVGLLFLGSVAAGEATGPLRPAAWLLALVIFPVVLVAAAWLRALRFPAPLRATGPVGHAVNVAAFFALYATPWYAPSLRVTSDAVLLFYGASMLLAAVRGYAGCEVLAVPNWLLRRDDQVGCVLFSCLDGPAGAAGTRRATLPGDRPARPPR